MSELKPVFQCDNNKCLHIVFTEGELCDDCLTMMLDQMELEEMNRRLSEAFGEAVDRTGW